MSPEIASAYVERLLAHWRLYLMEAAELAIFMISACVFTALLFNTSSEALHWIPSALGRRGLMGVSMGLTAVGIIKSPWGQLSGAHFNPAITLTFLRLGKIGRVDALFYIVSHFGGGVAGVGVTAVILGRSLAAPGVDYAVTIPGRWGVGAAFGVEFLMAAVLMAVVLVTSNQRRLAPYTTYCMGILIAVYIVLFAPVSGFSINPARTTGSAVFAHVWTAIWVYFSAPVIGMLLAAEVYVRTAGVDEKGVSADKARVRKHYFRHRHVIGR